MLTFAPLAGSRRRAFSIGAAEGSLNSQFNGDNVAHDIDPVKFAANIGKHLCEGDHDNLLDARLDMTLPAADVVKHAILGEAADPSGEVQNVSLGGMVGISDYCLVVVVHLRISHRNLLRDGRLFMAFIVLLISLSPLVVDSSCGYALITVIYAVTGFFSIANIGSLLRILPGRPPSVPFLPRTNDARDHRARRRSQADVIRTLLNLSP